MKINPEIFRKYDIRGVVDKDLTPKIVEILGKGIGTYLRERNKREIVIGRDTRLSSPEFRNSLLAGLISTGCKVIDLGLIPTPLLYFSIYYHKKEGGVMITGSHNPPEYNGFKIMCGEETLYGEQIQEIYKIISNERYIEEKGSYNVYNVIPEYQEYLYKNVRIEKKLKVVVDAGNGTGGIVAVPIFRKLGFEVEELYCEPDGNFPHHHPDPTIPEYLEDLKKKVKETGADIGLAFDGDADRLGVIDEKGNILWGDQLMIIFCRDILPSNPGAAIISEVKASQLLYDEIERLGGRPIMWKTGHSFIKKKIKEENALLAGEMSGHLFFADRYFGFDDAIYSALRLLEILSKQDKSLSQMLADLPKTYKTPEIRVYCSDQVKFKIVEKVRRKLAEKYPIIDIDGVRAIFPDGWGLVRASNTQPVLVLRFEAKTEQSLKEIESIVKTEIENAIRELGDS
ncbi:phosphomannomutase/phosphoglucomutase [Candidatus Aminicenantes bacterium AC-335-A11]|jgi:phosphomannomutase/phosphoglucomutase|nr:phosphomannomutase/phosphoglucomutase [SCandidatus Aminicenantes bacterium Aminicenantia_JdfR_composite]MCP2597795.1 phosphomannomutase/phosphoglucomutase [Candidatus Aminicenantes bacterium AC-335-L06]MCP2618476.1 phosphomannomutase/phosphoglucomutase [Candidatus Aminicenantes bacterium AC-335-A11]MCP2620520.1 phosphomannomutase/phosphoglucomutase [Candidatus Aminicenantes bacterium AC-334-E05]